jgi:hypothetical protein
MISVWSALAIWGITSGLAFRLLMDHQKTFKKTFRNENYVTKGDVVFVSMMSALPVVGLLLALAVWATEGTSEARKKWADSPSKMFNDD